MRLPAACRCRRPGTGSACRCGGPRSHGRRGSRSWVWVPSGAAHPGQYACDDVIAEGEQGGDGAGDAGRDVVSAGLAGLADEVLAAEVAQVVSGLPGGVPVLSGGLVYACGVLGDVKPAAAGASASSADRAARIRGLFRSTSAILPVPVWASSGGSSSTPSGRKPISAQPSAVANRPTIWASRVMIWSKLSRLRRKRSSLALWTVASKRSTCSPFV
jgi:hypothetical protein